MPWRTIQHAADRLQAGDTAIVHAGIYDERVSTTQGGTADTNRIMFRADGLVTMRGFSINHPYITVDGFDITGHSLSGRPKVGYVEVASAADFFQVIHNTFRDGIAIAADDLIFRHNLPATNDTISSATGGFEVAGFRPGLTLVVYKANKHITPLNKGRSYVIDTVTDHTITLRPDQSVSAEGPVLAYLDCSLNYGLAVYAGADNGIVRSNRFTNLSFDVMWCGGETNLYEDNIIEKCNGWNVFEYFGHDNVLRRNFIRTSPYVVYSPSPDVFENWSPQPAYRITFEENFVWNFDGALGVHHPNANAGALGPLLFRRNVFVNTSLFVNAFTNVTYVNNTFFQVATGALAVVAADPHPLECNSLPGSYSADGVVIKNNIFVDCGDQSQSVITHGWYKLNGVSDYVTDYNFVAGSAPSFDTKTGFDEGHPNLNGGDPGFVNINDPLGPDGIPFTDDDGLRLRSDSKLRGAGENGVDLGAYAILDTGPKLSIEVIADSSFRIKWPAAFDKYVLQSASSLTGEWIDYPKASSQEGDLLSVTITSPDSATFFRLTK